MKYNPQIVSAYFYSQGLDLPVMEYKFHDTRKWRFDFSWPQYKVALEVEGAIFARTAGRHNRGAGMRADMEKYNAANVLGWNILRVMPQDVAMLDTVNMVKACIARKGFVYEMVADSSIDRV